MNKKYDKKHLYRYTPDVMKLIVKIVKYSKGGLDRDEIRELGEDLLDIALRILEEVFEDACPKCHKSTCVCPKSAIAIP